MSCTEKAIRGLECCDDGALCEICPYAERKDSTLACVRRLAYDALELLKTQKRARENDPFMLYLALYAPAPENAPND